MAFSGEAVPTCDVCGSDLRLAGDDEFPYWWCSSCGLAYLPQAPRSE